ncbi:MAG: acetyl-CoA carboxylase carboxyltransferase subunit beta, partial [Nitrospinaceae bacterium]
RLKAALKDNTSKDSLISGTGQIEENPVEICAFHFKFMGGSMGAVVGEKITRAIERAVHNKNAIIIVSCSGGARMQEGIFSLMQMAKTATALQHLAEHHLPFISILTDPTTGGVSASFAFLGDVILAEPGALIGFAGPRVIEQTIKQKLPEGFQRAEFLLEHGLIDQVVHRRELRETVSKILSLLRDRPIQPHHSLPAS